MDKKIERIISMYNRIINGDVINKAQEAVRFGVNEKSIQRDLEDIRSFFAENPESNQQLE